MVKKRNSWANLTEEQREERKRQMRETRQRNRQLKTETEKAEGRIASAVRGHELVPVNIREIAFHGIERQEHSAPTDTELLADLIVHVWRKIKAVA